MKILLALVQSSRGRAKIPLQLNLLHDFAKTLLRVSKPAQRECHLHDGLSQAPIGLHEPNLYQSLLTPRAQSRQVRTVLHRLLPHETTTTRNKFLTLFCWILRVVQLLQNLFDHLLQRRNIFGHSLPNYAQIYPEIVMN